MGRPEVGCLEGGYTSVVVPLWWDKLRQSTVEYRGIPGVKAPLKVGHSEAKAPMCEAPLIWHSLR